MEVLQVRMGSIAMQTPDHYTCKGRQRKTAGRERNCVWPMVPLVACVCGVGDKFELSPWLTPLVNGTNSG